MSKTVTRTIPSVIDKEYREYAMYVLEQRAIPNAIDGLKPVQRKILYQLIHEYRSGKNKLSEIGGSLSSINYHHGEAAAVAAAVKMGQDWDNNLTLLQNAGDCNFGSRLVHDAAAARYIFGHLSKNFDTFFKDTELAPPRPDKDDPEPLFYLPVIPWILVNGIRGIAVGFACHYQPYNPKDLAKACIAYMTGHKIPELKPWYKNFNGTIKRNDEGVWTAYGIYEQVGQTEIHIKECTPSESCESYISFLNKMLELDRITDYVDRCEKGRFHFILKVSRQQRDWFLQNPFKRLNIEETLNENLTSIGADGKLKVFGDVSEIIAYFCEVRKKFYSDRRLAKLAETLSQLRVARLRRAFVQAVLDDKIRLKGAVKASLQATIEAKLKATPEESAKLVQMNVYHFCEDSIKELDKEISDLEAFHKKWDATIPNNLFLEELAAVK